MTTVVDSVGDSLGEKIEEIKTSEAGKTKSDKEIEYNQ